LLQSRPLPALPFVARFRTGAGRRALGLGLTLLIEALLLLVLLTLGPGSQPEAEERRAATTLSVRDVSEEAPEEPRPEPQRQAETPPAPQRPSPEAPPVPQPDAPTPPPVAPPAPAAPPLLPMRWNLAPPNPLRSAERPATPARPVYGPPDNRSAAMRDSARVGTAPNGEPLYAAEWYREPEDAMLRAYLSGARGPGWGLIACRTAPDFRVEDCVALSEYPEGSNMNRSILAAAWEFRVRPPRRGGQPLVGSWVRIRIDYR